MVQGSDDDEDWEKICAQEGLELVQESGTESEGRREGWMSDRDNEGTESEMVGEGSESERESVLDSDSESVSIVTVKNRKAVNMAGMTVTVNTKKKVKVSQFRTVKGVNMAA